MLASPLSTLVPVPGMVLFIYLPIDIGHAREVKFLAFLKIKYRRRNFVLLLLFVRVSSGLISFTLILFILSAMAWE